MRHNPGWHCTLLTFMWWGMSTSCHSFADESLIERVQTEAMQGWRQHEQASTFMGATIRFDEEAKQGEKIVASTSRSIQVKIGLSEGYRFQAEQLSPPPKSRSVRSGGKNHRYSFGMMNGAISSVQFDRGDGLSDRLDRTDASTLRCLELLRGAYCLFGMLSLPDALEEHRLTILSAENTSMLVKIRCTLRHDEPNSFITPDKPIEITLDPLNGWAIREVSLEQSPHRPVVCQYEYATEPYPNGTLRPLQSLSITDSDSTSSESRTYRYEDISFAPIDPKEFTLSSFGFPEPIPPEGPAESAHMRMWLAVLCLGVGCLVGGWYVRRRTAT